MNKPEIVLNSNELLAKLSRGRNEPVVVALTLEPSSSYPLGHTLHIPLADPVFDGEYIELCVTESGWHYGGIVKPDCDISDILARNA